MRIREIAQSRVRYGYRKIRVLLSRRGWDVGKYLVSAVQEEGLALKKRPQRKREKQYGTGKNASSRQRPTRRRRIDFVADQLQDGERFRALTILDVYTREGVAIEAGQSLKEEDVVRVLNGVKCQQRGVPKFLFCDNGSEFTSQAMDLWAYQNGMKIDFSLRASRPTTPSSNRSTEPSEPSA